MGVSGTVLFVPFYTMVFPLLGHHLEPVQAVEVGLITEIFGFISSTSAFWRAGLIDFQIAGFAVLLATPTAILGGYLSHFLPGNWLLGLIGAALVVFAYLLVGETTEAVHEEPESTGEPKVKVHRDRLGRTYHYKVLNDFWRGSAAGFGGILQGLVGFSAGELSTAEQVLRGMPVRIAAGNSHLIIAAASISAVITHLAVSASQGTKIPWNLVAATIPAVLIGGQLASVVAGRLPQETLRIVLAGFLAFIGLLSGYRASIASEIHIPAWVLWASFLLCLAAMALFFRRRRRGVIRQGSVGTCSSCGREEGKPAVQKTSD
jgi:uncharacterized membrane protein YfcA